MDFPKSEERPRAPIANTHVKLSKGLHRAAKIYAVTHGITLRQLICESLESVIAEDRPDPCRAATP